MTAVDRQTIIEQLTAGYDWTAARIAVIEPADLGRPTPCPAFDLRQLLDHLNGSVARFVAVAGGDVPADDGADPVARFGSLPAASLAAWTHADLTATYELPIGALPAPFVARINLAEVVVHGWDVGRATGERADVPDELAAVVESIGHELLTEDRRGPAFGPPQPGGSSASERMAAFYGRRV